LNNGVPDLYWDDGIDYAGYEGQSGSAMFRAVDASGSTWTDSSGNGNDATLSGGYTITTGNPDEEELLKRSIFAPTGLAFEPFTWGECFEYVSYFENVVMARNALETGAVTIREILVYLWAKAWTPSEIEKNNNYLEDEGSTLVPFEVLDGQGGEAPWLDINGSVLLLQPAA